MNQKRALSQKQFIQSGFDASGYSFIEEEGTFVATIDIKVWGNRNLISYMTLNDGRKIKACTFPEDYLGMADMPFGSTVKITFKKSKSGKIYLREAIFQS